MKYIQTVLIICLFSGVSLCVAQQPPAIVATTSWAAAFVRAAGIDDVLILAPAEMPHPPEYELRPTDIPKIMGADILVYAGYETMIQKIQTALGVQQEKMLRITTQYDWPSLRTSVLKIAEAAGTTAKAEEHLRRIEAWYRNAKQELEKQGLLGVPVLVHLFQKPFAEELGFEIRGVFGPAPLEARQIGEAAKHRVHFILDNKHNPLATPLSEVLPQATYCQLINFPGSEGTVSLEDVLQYNLSTLLE